MRIRCKHTSNLPITGVIRRLQQELSAEARALVADRCEFKLGELMAIFEIVRICGIDDEMLFRALPDLSAVSLGHIRNGTSSYSPEENLELAKRVLAVLRTEGIQFYDGNAYDRAA